MAWRETEASKAVRPRLRYRCDDCSHVFDHRPESEDEPAPDCPRCPKVATGPRIAWVPPLPAIGTTKGAAIDLAQKIAEEDYGLTDINDNQRVGDIAFKAPPPMQTAEREALTREMIQAGIPEQITPDLETRRDNYWQGQQAAASTEGTIGASSVAAGASQAARDLGADPVGILEKGRETGNMPLRMKIISSCTAEDAKAASAGG